MALMNGYGENIFSSCGQFRPGRALVTVVTVNRDLPSPPAGGLAGHLDLRHEVELGSPLPTFPRFIPGGPQ
jgi:hypothetical protein